MNNQTAFLVQPFKMEILDTEIPMPKEDEVLIEVQSIGICGSDLGFFADPTNAGQREVVYPIVLGHECGGRIVDVGKNVKHLSRGDLVAVEPGVPCGECEWCRSGHYNLCPSLTFLAAPPFEKGALSRYITHPAAYTYKLQPGMAALDGALLEPLSIGMYAVKRGDVRLGDTVAVLGAGCIGLMNLMAAKAAGAGMVMVVDIFDNRLEMAKEIGADIVINSAKQDLPEEARKVTGDRGFDHVFESAGNPATTKAALDTVRKGGNIIMVGLNHTPTPFDFYAAARKECDILSVWRYVNMYPLAMKAVASGKIDPKKIVTDIFEFQDVQNAFERSYKEKQTMVKAAIKF